MKTDLNWLVFGLFQEEYNRREQTLRVTMPRISQLLIYQFDNSAIAMRFDCPYWIRIEGSGWGMMLAMTSEGTFMRALRGDSDKAERDLFLLRLILPVYVG